MFRHLITAIRQAVRAWLRRRELRIRRASIVTPFD
jgi:hypothetical protein